jgi:ketosteroid isomerase-like protein
MLLTEAPSENSTFVGIDRLTFSGLLSDTLMSGTAGNISIQLIRSAERKRFLLLALVALFCAGMLQAGQSKPNKHDARHEISGLENKWRDALLSSDTNAMSALLADDYMAITASGTLQTKQEVLANLKTRRVHITSIELSDRKVRFYGSTAVVTSLAEVQGTNGEGDVTGRFRYTRVYVRDAQGKWKIVSFESSRIREHKRPPEPAPDTQ